MKKPKRSLVFEGNTWEVYEALKARDPRLHKSLCNILEYQGGQTRLIALIADKLFGGSLKTAHGVGLLL